MIAGGLITGITQLFADLLNIFTGQAVDDPAGIGMFLQIGQDTGEFIARFLHLKIEVLSVESGRHHDRILQFQNLYDVVFYRVGSGGCKRTDYRAFFQLIDEGADFQVTGTKILSPLRDAVGFIHADHGNPDMMR